MAKYRQFLAVFAVIAIGCLSGWLAIALIPDRVARLDNTSRKTVAATINLFKDRGFDIYTDFYKDVTELPPIFMTELPDDLPAVLDPSTRKKVFVSIVLPHVLYANDRVRNDRRRLDYLNRAITRGSALRGRDLRWLEMMAEIYRTEPNDVEELLRRVDIIPPRLAVAQAAQESGWGTSRFAQTGNALFGQHAPLGTGALQAARNKTIALKVFETLQGSVRDYMRNLNRNRAYRKFRELRFSMSALKQPLDAVELAGSLSQYSEEGELYVERLRSVMKIPEVASAENASLSEPRK